ncbi:MAG: hypothetical protein ACYDD6_09020, partial [Acidimicrobiales bacterium]
DTRTTAPVAGGSTATVPVGGAGSVPANATAAVLNVTDLYTASSGGNYLTVFPTGAVAPTAADVNYTTADTYDVVPNASYATVGNSAAVSILNGPASAGSANVVVDAFGYFVSSGTQAYTVSPSSSQSVPASASASGTQGDVTYTVSGLNTADTPQGYVDIALFPSTGANAPSDTTGSWTFASSAGSGKAGAAAGQNTTNDGTPPSSCTTTCSGFITSVNGVATSGTPTTEKAVSVTSGTLTFVVNSAVADGTIPVVFTEPSATASGTLQLSASGQPAPGYQFGVGGPIAWAPATAQAGTYNGWVVQQAPGNGTFEACALQGSPSATGQSCYVFSDSASDTYQYDESGSGTSSASTQTSVISESTFVSELSAASPAFSSTPTVPGDVLNITYGPPSTFAFAPNSNGVVRGAPPGATAASGSSGGAAVSWTAPVNPDVWGYNVYRATVSGGTAGTFAVLGSAQPTVTGSPSACSTSPGCVVSTPPALTYADTTAAPGSTYEYEVQAIADGQNGGSQGPVSTATASVSVIVPATTAPVSTAISQVHAPSSSALASGDTFTVTFNQPITVASSWALTITDGTNTGTLTNNTVTESQAQGTSTVSFLVTGAPSCPTGTCPSLNGANGAEIFSASGFTGTSSLMAWNLPGSGLDAALGASDRQLSSSAAGSNANIPNATATPLVTMSSAPSTVKVTCPTLTGTDEVTAYSSRGTPIGQATCSSGQSITLATSSFASTDTLLITATPQSAGAMESLADLTGPLPATAAAEQAVGSGDAWNATSGGDNGDSKSVTINGTSYGFVPASSLWTATSGNVSFNGPSSTVVCKTQPTGTSSPCIVNNVYGLYTAGSATYYLDLTADVQYFSNHGGSANTAYLALTVSPGFGSTVTAAQNPLEVSIGTVSGTSFTASPSSATTIAFEFENSTYTAANPVVTYIVSASSTN